MQLYLPSFALVVGPGIKMLKCYGEPKRGLWKTTFDQCDYDDLGTLPEFQMSSYPTISNRGTWVTERGKRSQGRQRKTLQTVVIADAKRFTGSGKPNITLNELKTIATDRNNLRVFR